MITAKSCGPAPRAGHPNPVAFDWGGGLLNAIGLTNPGAEAEAKLLAETRQQLQPLGVPLIASIFGGLVEEFAQVAQIIDAAQPDLIEVNISCPNVKEGGVQFGNYPDMSARVVEACRKATSKPIVTKLSPNQTDIQENARRCIEAGSDALAVINTISGMAIDVKTRRPVIGNVQGGVSGPAIKPIALLKVHQVYQVARPHGVPIIGQGGICSAEDALEFIIAGAATVGVGTALFYDPLVCRKINAGIADYLAAGGFASVADLTGTLDTSRPA